MEGELDVFLRRDARYHHAAGIARGVQALVDRILLGGAIERDVYPSLSGIA